ncbi:MAG: sigma-70 family RNA polymerase sigma factor [Oscillospiraceae bacterium]|nr:sigma-70 family RNA polymerase sigma factor [Oscillospiraceae bacterium]
MDDLEIIELFWNRNEKAINETQKKYNSFLMRIANAVLGNPLDCEEAVNDTYLRVWDSVPSDRPGIFSAYLAKITRCLSIDTFRKLSAKKRGSGEYVYSLDELNECVTDGKNPQSEAEMKELTEKINCFLSEQNKRNRDIFIQRYFYFFSIRNIAEHFAISENNVKIILSRIRKELKEYLQTEGY